MIVQLVKGKDRVKFTVLSSVTVIKKNDELPVLLPVHAARKVYKQYLSRGYVKTG